MTEQTLRTAMAEYGDTVYRLALCRTQSIPDAEDVYQDVFLALLRQQAEGWEAGRMKAWLVRTTLNRCTDLHRFRLPAAGAAAGRGFACRWTRRPQSCGRR